MVYPASSHDPASYWDQLHEQPRFRPVYPDENVVRFLIKNYNQLLDQARRLRVLDLGVGGGRHIKLLCELGFDAYGFDVSMTGLRYTREWLRKNSWKAGLVRASMVTLPFKDELFDAVISVGVLHYGDRRDLQQAIQEVHRVLKLGGKTFVALKTIADYRFGKGEEIEPDTFIMKIHETNEYGTIHHFLSEKAVFEHFSLFSGTELEKIEITFDQRRSVNSDWLITAEK